MSSERKQRAARANGALAKGRKTPEGIARSATNAVTHGLNARNLVLANESEEEFQTMRDSYLAALKPRDQVELGLVEQLVAARWRLERVLSIEAAALDVEMIHQKDEVEENYDRIDGDTRLYLAFRSLADDSKVLALLNRYEARHRRDADRALAALHAHRKLQNEILQNDANPKNGHPGVGRPPWSAAGPPAGPPTEPDPPLPQRLPSVPSHSPVAVSGLP